MHEDHPAKDRGVWENQKGVQDLHQVRCQPIMNESASTRRLLVNSSIHLQPPRYMAILESGVS